MSLALALLGALRAALRTRTDLALENLALRQQLALLRRRSKRPRFGRLDRFFSHHPKIHAPGLRLSTRSGTLACSGARRGGVGDRLAEREVERTPLATPRLGPYHVV